MSKTIQKRILSSLLIILVLFTVACGQSPQKLTETMEIQTQLTNNNTRRATDEHEESLSTSDVKILLEGETNIVLVDVRPSSSYEISHITGAVSIPITELGNRLGEILKDRQIIVYAQCH